MNQQQHSSLFVFIMICCIATIPSISSDIFVPSIPAISDHFSVSIDQIQLIISVLMCSLAFSQLIYGPVSAAYGRKGPLCFGLIMIFIGTAINAYAQSIAMLTIGHIFEGIGLGGCSLFRAMLRDCYDGKDLRQKSAYANMLCTLFYPAAPMIGGYLQVFFGWRANFVFLTLLSLAALVMVTTGPETNRHRNPDQLKPEYVFKVYQLLLTHNAFVGYCLCIMLAMMGYFSWIMAIPLYVIKHLNHSPDDVGVMMLIISASSILLGGAINNHIINRYQTDSVITTAWIWLVILALLPLACYYQFDFSALWIYSCMWLYLFTTAFLWPNIYTKAFAPFQHLAGQAGAIYGNAYTMGSFFSALLMGYASESNPYGLCAILVCANIGSLVIYYCVIAPHQLTLQEQI